MDFNFLSASIGYILFPIQRKYNLKKSEGGFNDTNLSFSESEIFTALVPGHRVAKGL
jgi:hypothetical protein